MLLGSSRHDLSAEFCGSLWVGNPDSLQLSEVCSVHTSTPGCYFFSAGSLERVWAWASEELGDSPLSFTNQEQDTNGLTLWQDLAEGKTVGHGELSFMCTVPGVKTSLSSEAGETSFQMQVCVDFRLALRVEG